MMGAPVLTVIMNTGDNVNRLTFSQECIHLGKHPDNEICTGGHSSRVSRNHAALSWDGVRWLVRDLNSRYGTYVSDRPVEGDATLEVRSGDRIRLGDVELEVRYESQHPTSREEFQ